MVTVSKINGANMKNLETSASWTDRFGNEYKSGESSQLPAGIFAMGLSTTAIALLGYICAIKNPETVRVSVIEATLGMARDKRIKATKELVEAGILQTGKVGQGGVKLLSEWAA